MAENALSTTEIENQEHISYPKTGDNIAAKRVAQYGYIGNGLWGRLPVPLIDTANDSGFFSNPDANGNYQTLTFNSGGSGGTVVRTLSFTYDGNGNVTSYIRT